MYIFGETNDGHLLSLAYALRYQVYVAERGWLTPNEGCSDHDEYDQYSRLFCCVDKEKGVVVGTARAIRPTGLRLPFEEVANHGLPDDRRLTYEVSRLAVDPLYRKQQSCVLIGLVRSVWRAMSEEGMKHWCAVVDKVVYRQLRIIGFKFLFAGNPVEHVGSVCVPVICTMDQSEAVLFNERNNLLLRDHSEVREVASVACRTC